MTVQEYATFKRLSLAAAYKRVKEGRAKSERKFGKIIVGVPEKELTEA